MGSRHNRKRVRSRPRHRRPHQHFHDDESLPMILENTPWNPCASPFDSSRSSASSPVSVTSSIHGNLVTTPDNKGIHRSHDHRRILLTNTPARYEVEMEKARLHMYGGEEGDDSALCAPMLQVVMDLFGGNVDYEDD